MPEEDFEADSDEDEASCDFDFDFKEVTGPFADDPAGPGDREGNQADEDDGHKNMFGDKREGKADGQGIDAGGDAQDQQDEHLGGIWRFFFGLFNLKGLEDHLAADEGQQAEGDPVIHGLNPLVQLIPGHPPEQGHEGLKTAEEQGHAETLADAQFAEDRAADDRDREGVHCQADGNADNQDGFGYVH